MRSGIEYGACVCDPSKQKDDDSLEIVHPAVDIRHSRRLPKNSDTMKLKRIFQVPMKTWPFSAGVNMWSFWTNTLKKEVSVSEPCDVIIQFIPGVSNGMVLNELMVLHHYWLPIFTVEIVWFTVITVGLSSHCVWNRRVVVIIHCFCHCCVVVITWHHVAVIALQ